MVESEGVQVDGVQPALGGGTGGLEEGIDIPDIAARVDENGSDDGPEDNIGVVEEDEVEM